MPGPGLLLRRRVVASVRALAVLSLLAALLGCAPDEDDAVEQTAAAGQTPSPQPPSGVGALVPLEVAPPATPQRVDLALLERIGTVTTAPGDLPRLTIVREGEKLALPLEHTHVRAEVSGPVARVEVTQTYRNPLDVPIEAIYVFPLPENSAVDAMKMVIGERVVEARIERRADARQIYETAKTQGFTTALLEQERPDVFTQSVANIAPGEDIEVVIGYVQDVTYDAGGYEFVFPMVVGPRYVPSLIDKGRGVVELVPDPSVVPDWKRISPPILGAGLRTGHDISLELTADLGGVEVSDIASPTHEVAVEAQGEGRFSLMLAEQESQPNRDFVVRYRTGAAQPAVGLVSHKPSADASHGYFTLMVQPPALDLETLVGERELVFVVDISGSMNGRPLALCKDAMRKLLRGLRPRDTFNVITFSGRDAKLFEASVPASTEHVSQAMEFIGGLQAGGGTHLGSAVEAALGATPQDGRHRYVFFMTDAQVGNEDEILRDTQALVARFQGAQDAQGAKARVFSFGVGHHPNHYLIEQLARTGQGLAVYASADEDPGRAVDRFFGLIDHAVMEQLTIDWGGLPVELVQPAELPDLFASRPLVVHGRYAGAGGRAEVVVHGRVAGEPVELVFDVALEAAAHGSPAQATLWARSRIDELERRVWARQGAQEAIEAITTLALEHRIVSAYTSFVAVDTSRVVGDGDPLRLEQPSEPKDGAPGEPAQKALPRTENNPSPGSSQSDQKLSSADSMSNLLGTGTPAQGFDSSAAAGNSSGNYGLGLMGGKGGGGGIVGPNTGGFGTGSFGTAGRGGGGTGGRDYGKGEGKLGEKSVAAPKLKAGRPEVAGALDPKIVRRVVHRHKRELQACYDQALLTTPLMASARIVVAWTIDASGNVADATVERDTTGSTELTSCITKALETWRFPSPKSGGAVKVSYPFTFEGEAGPAMVSALELSGPLDAAALAATLNHRRDEVSGCHVLAERAPEGRLRFTIDARGFVVGATLEGEESELGRCLVERSREWRFAESEGETTVAGPLSAF